MPETKVMQRKNNSQNIACDAWDLRFANLRCRSRPLIYIAYFSLTGDQAGEKACNIWGRHQRSANRREVQTAPSWVYNTAKLLIAPQAFSQPSGTEFNLQSSQGQLDWSSRLKVPFFSDPDSYTRKTGLSGPLPHDDTGLSMRQILPQAAANLLSCTPCMRAEGISRIWSNSQTGRADKLAKPPVAPVFELVYRPLRTEPLLSHQLHKPVHVKAVILVLCHKWKCLQNFQSLRGSYLPVAFGPAAITDRS